MTFANYLGTWSTTSATQYAKWRMIPAAAIAAPIFDRAHKGYCGNMLLDATKSTQGETPSSPKTMDYGSG